MVDGPERIYIDKHLMLDKSYPQILDPRTSDISDALQYVRADLATPPRANSLVKKLQACLYWAKNNGGTNCLVDMEIVEGVIAALSAPASGLSIRESDLLKAGHAAMRLDYFQEHNALADMMRKALAAYADAPAPDSQKLLDDMAAQLDAYYKNFDGIDFDEKTEELIERYQALGGAK